MGHSRLEKAPTSKAILPIYKVGEDGKTLVAAGEREPEVWDKEAMMAEFYNMFGLWKAIN